MTATPHFRMQRLTRRFGPWVLLAWLFTGAGPLVQACCDLDAGSPPGSAAHHGPATDHPHCCSLTDPAAPVAAPVPASRAPTQGAIAGAVHAGWPLAPAGAARGGSRVSAHADPPVPRRLYLRTLRLLI